MSLLAKQVAALTQRYRPPVPQPTSVHRIYDDPDEEPMPAPKPTPSRRDIKWIRASILRAVESSDTPLAITDISERTNLKWDRVRKSVDRLVEQGKLTKVGEPRKYRYTITKDKSE